MMDTPTGVIPMSENHCTAAGEVFSRAFFDDPLLCYAWPDPAMRREKLPVFQEAVCRLGYLAGHAYTTAPRVEGAVLWMPPGHGGFTPEQLEMSGVNHAVAIWGEEAWGRFVAHFAHLDELHQRDMPAPHWYLWGIAVDPARQGQGVGSRLLQPILGRADATGLPCYTETDNPRNVAFYRRHGFEVVVEGDDPNGGPHYWTMRRQPHPMS
jgi:ribosomal protein S18 acetylase RimI-like enzyme